MSHFQGDIVVNPEEAPPPYDDRPLPPGWIYQYETNHRAYFYVDVGAEPPRSSWIHPLEDPIYIASIPDLSSSNSVNPGITSSRVDIQSFTSTPTSTSMSTSDSATKIEPRKGLGERLMDRLTGTSREEREEKERRERARREKERREKERREKETREKEKKEKKEMFEAARMRQLRHDEAKRLLREQRSAEERARKETGKRMSRSRYEDQLRTHQRLDTGGFNNGIDFANFSSYDAGFRFGGGDGGGCGGGGGG